MQKQQDRQALMRWMGSMLLLVFIVAAFFRFWQIGDLPPGLFGDEAADGLDALDVLAGRGQVFFPGNFGREGLHMWIVALFIRLLGVNPLALRLPSAMAGVLAVLGTFWLGYELFIHRRRPAWPGTNRWLGRIPSAWLIPVLAALYLGTSFWHVHFSRFGIRGVFSTTMLAFTAAALWRAFNTHRWRWFAAAGLFMGLGAHFYTASRFVPVFVGLFMAGWLLFSWRGRLDERVNSVSHFLVGGVILFAVAGLVFAPLGYYFLTHPGSFTQRASEVSVFNQGSLEGGLRLAGKAAAANLLQFIWPGRGDMARFYNLPGRAVFEPLSALFTVLGLIVCLRRRRNPVYGFLLLWLLIMFTPAMLAVDRYPTLPRLLGLLPGLMFLPALGLVSVLDGLKARLHAWPRLALAVAVLLPLVGLASHAGAAARDYFQVWGRDALTADAFEQDMVDAWRWLQTEPHAQPVYLSSDLYKHPTFMFLYEQVPTTRYFQVVDPQLHWFDARQSWPLSQQPATIVAGHSALPPAWLQQRLGISMQPLGQGYAFVTSPSPPPEPAFAIPFGDHLSLIDQRVVLPASGSPEAIIVQFWRSNSPEAVPGHSYQIQSALAADDGFQYVQASQDMAFRAVEWPSEGVFLTWQNLSWPAEEPTHTVLRLVPHGQPPLVNDSSDDEGWVLLPLRPW